MSLVLFANTKGGSGKTTAALVFAGEVLKHGAKLVLFEGDPNQPLARWASRRNVPVIMGADAKPRSTAECTQAIEKAAADGSRLVVVHDGDEDRVFDWIEAATAWAHFVVADPEGSPNQWLQDVAQSADLVVIPFAPTALDAHQVSKTVTVLGRVGRRTGRRVPHRVLLTRAGVIQTRDERKIRLALQDGGMPVLATSLRDRPAFRAIFDVDKDLSELDGASVNGLDGARVNAAELANEIISVLNTTDLEVAA